MLIPRERRLAGAEDSEGSTRSARVAPESRTNPSPVAGRFHLEGYARRGVYEIYKNTFQTRAANA